MIADLQTFSKLRLSLKTDLERLHETIVIFSKDGTHAFADDVSGILQRLATDSFKVLVVGEFSTGKSTFLNAILGQRLLPTETTETTATINIIKYGEKPTAVVHFWGQRDQTGIETSLGRKEEIKLHDLHRFVTSLTRESNEIARTVKFVELYLPSNYCRNSVQLVDTPGLNTTYEYHELTTLEYLQNGHFGIMLLNATQFLTASELRYLERFRTYMNKVMFIVNYVNQMPPGDSFEDNQPYFQRKLKKVLTTERNIILYPLNALLAEQGNQKESGLDLFLKDFEAFLTSDGKAKEMLLPPIIQASNTIKALIKNNDIACSALSFSPFEFQKKVDQLLPKLDLLSSKQNDLLTYLDRNQELIVQRYTSFAEEQAQKKAFQIKNEIAEWPGESDSLKEELSDYLKAQVIETGTTIQEFVKTEVSAVVLEARSRYQDLLADISNYQNDFISSLQSDNDFAITEVSNLSIADDATSDLSHLAWQFGGSFAIGYFLAAIFTGPFGWIAGMFGGGIWGRSLQEKARKNKLSNLAQQVHKQLLQQFRDSIPGGAKSIRQAFLAEREDLNDKLNSQLSSIRHTIDSVESEMHQEESKVFATRKTYQDFNFALADIHARLEKTKNVLTER